MTSSNCHRCIFKEDVPGDCHIKCTNPDPEMTGNEHAINKGWFYYPYLFSPTWMEKVCSNFKEKEEK